MSLYLSIRFKSIHYQMSVYTLCTLDFMIIFPSLQLPPIYQNNTLSLTISQYSLVDFQKEVTSQHLLGISTKTPHSYYFCYRTYSICWAPHAFVVLQHHSVQTWYCSSVLRLPLMPLKIEKIPPALATMLERLANREAFLACLHRVEFLLLLLEQVAGHPCHLTDLPLLPEVASNVKDLGAVVAAKKIVKTEC